MIYNEKEKNDLYNDYIINNLTGKEIQAKYNITKKQLFTKLNFYGIKKPDLGDAITQEYLNKLYITDNKTIEEIVEITHLSYNSIRYYIKKFNIKKSQEDIQKTRENNNLKKYGIKNLGWTNEAQEKIKKTCQEKYGVDSPLASEEIQNKIKATNIERYGVDNPIKTKEGQQILVDGIREKYNVEWACLTQNCINSMTTKDSKPNLLFESLLEENNISFTREYRINNRSYDFKVGNILIEINPTATHNSTFGVHGKNPIDKNYHKNKTDLAKLHDFQCIQVFDWDDQNKIISMIKDKKSIYARKCEIMCCSWINFN